MKTKFLIIIVITILAVSITYVSFAYNQEIKLATGMMQREESPPHWITAEDYCSEWCDQNELYDMGCGKPILAHLTKHSNLLDEKFNGNYAIEEIGLPDGVTKENFQECVDFILETRIKELENNLEPTSGLGVLHALSVADKEKLQKILDDCDTPSMGLDIFFEFTNGTHYIDNLDCEWVTISNEERDVKLAAGYKLYPGVGWVAPADQNTMEPIYRDNPETGEKVLDLDAMLLIQDLDKMTLFEDPFYTDPDKFVEVYEKKDSKCFTTPSMNYFCYVKPRIYEEGSVSTLISNTTKISGELHFDNVNIGPSYFTIKNMTQIKGDTAKITFADKDYRVGNATSTLYEITDDFEFTEIIEKFDTFVVKCDNYDGTSVTIVQYLGITTIDSIDYFMTWHLNAHSKDGIACDYPQIIQNSFDNDFGNIGHNWGEIENEN